MLLSQETKAAYLNLIRQELLVSQGCTEPAAIAYASALCRKYLNKMPEHIHVSCSGNLFKNAKSAKIPHTDQLKGIAAAATAGVVGGDASLFLQVLEPLTPKNLAQIHSLLQTDFCDIFLLDSNDNLHIIVEAFCDDESVLVEIRHEHTCVTRVLRNGEPISYAGSPQASIGKNKMMPQLNMLDICLYADTVELTGELVSILRKQIEYNVNICEEGMARHWGASIGRLLYDNQKNDIACLACAFAAAGSDARMSGCALPVVINSGSGNQGITVTAPVYVYAKAFSASEEKMLRALIISNLLSIYQKSMIGRLSAYCGAVSAACGAGAAITYLQGGTHEQILHTFSNATAFISGILCDGAKPSCAAKIACAVNGAILAHKMAMSGNNLQCGDGIVGPTPEDTVHRVGYLAREGLVDIDQLMLNVMMQTSQKNSFS